MEPAFHARRNARSGTCRPSRSASARTIEPGSSRGCTWPGGRQEQPIPDVRGDQGAATRNTSECPATCRQTTTTRSLPASVTARKVRSETSFGLRLAANHTSRPDGDQASHVAHPEESVVFFPAVENDDVRSFDERRVDRPARCAHSGTVRTVNRGAERKLDTIPPDNGKSPPASSLRRRRRPGARGYLCQPLSESAGAWRREHLTASWLYGETRGLLTICSAAWRQRCSGGRDSGLPRRS